MSTCLGDLFPDELKVDYAGRALSPKNIIVISVPQFNVPYDKMMVLITSSKDNEYMGCVSINTNPSPQENHVVLSATDHEFLQYDSHMSCSTITPISANYIKQILTEDPNRIKGEITDQQHMEIIQKLKASKGVTPMLKQQFNL
jgi:hypothetical protein